MLLVACGVMCPFAATFSVMSIGSYCFTCGLFICLHALGVVQVCCFVRMVP